VSLNTVNSPKVSIRQARTIGDEILDDKLSIKSEKINNND